MNRPLLRLLPVPLLLLPWLLNAAELEVRIGEQTRHYRSEELLQRAQPLKIAQDVAYQRSMTYQAIPLAELLPGLQPDDHLQAVASDGFAAELPAAPLLQKQGSRAWLAIEDKQQPWPPLGQGKPSAGPFYLVWTDPAQSQIGPEQWPFQVVRLTQVQSVAQRFPAMVPAANAAPAVQQGFALFQKHCLACHRLNGAGDSAFGPDLNLPHNPTEYFRPEYLNTYIRDPQSLRRWPQAMMPGFDKATLSDSELQQLLEYLAHMPSRRPTR